MWMMLSLALASAPEVLWVDNPDASLTDDDPKLDRLLQKVGVKYVRPAVALKTVDKDPRGHDDLRRLTAEAATLEWDDRPPLEWARLASYLYASTERVFVDDPDDRELVFDALVQLGRAAENANMDAPPLFEPGIVPGEAVNYGFYQAAVLAEGRPELLERIGQPEARASVGWFADNLHRSDRVRRTALSFARSGTFNVRGHAERWATFINGDEVVVTQATGLVLLPRGRYDVRLRAVDGQQIRRTIDTRWSSATVIDEHFFEDGATKFLQATLDEARGCERPRVSFAVAAELDAHEDRYGETLVAWPVEGKRKVRLYSWERYGLEPLGCD